MIDENILYEEFNKRGGVLQTLELKEIGFSNYKIKMFATQAKHYNRYLQKLDKE